MKTSPLIAIAVGKAPRKSKAKKSAEAAPTAMTEYKPPSTAERVVSRAHDSKVNATQDWVEGKISSTKHNQIHKRANKVIAADGHVGSKPSAED